MRFDYSSIERRENGHADILRGKVGNLGVNPRIPVISIIAAVIGQKP